MKTCEDCIHIAACITSIPPVPICDNFAHKTEFVQVVRCKDCKWFIPKHILLDDGTRRAYTEEEKKLPLGVDMTVGINCGSRCNRYLSWEKNRIPVYCQENDFCSYGERRCADEGPV